MQTKLQYVYPLQLQCFSNDGVTGHDYDWTDWKWLDNTKAPAFRHVFHFLTIALHTAEYIKCKLTQHDTTWKNKTKKNSQDMSGHRTDWLMAHRSTWRFQMRSLPSAMHLTAFIALGHLLNRTCTRAFRTWHKGLALAQQMQHEHNAPTGFDIWHQQKRKIIMNEEWMRCIHG